MYNNLGTNTHEIWDIMKSQNLQIIVVQEEEETQVKGAEDIFSKIIEEKFLHLKKGMCINVQEAFRTPKAGSEKQIPMTHCNLNIKCVEKRQIIKSCKGKRPSHI